MCLRTRESVSVRNKDPVPAGRRKRVSVGIRKPVLFGA